MTVVMAESLSLAAILTSEVSPGLMSIVSV